MWQRNTAPKSCYGDVMGEDGAGSGVEPNEFPRTETGRMTGWEDGTIHFSLEPP